MQMKITKKGRYIKNVVSDLPTITFSLGNKKLSSKILIWSLPTIDTCPNCSECKYTCYARKAEKLYPTVRPCREANWQASKLDSFIERTIKTIEQAYNKYGARIIRIHEAGDFYSRNYAMKWEYIATSLKQVYPDLLFYSYTKSPHKPLQGVNVVNSLMPDGSINFGTKKEIFKLAKKYKSKICPYGLTPKSVKLICGETCNACLKHTNIVFVKH